MLIKLFFVARKHHCWCFLSSRWVLAQPLSRKFNFCSPKESATLIKLLVLQIGICPLRYVSQLQTGFMFPGVRVTVQTVRAELCAEMSLKINQAYQSDRCLSTCYKLLPRLTPAPFLPIIYRVADLVICLFTLCNGSNIRSVIRS